MPVTRMIPATPTTTPAVVNAPRTWLTRKLCRAISTTSRNDTRTPTAVTRIGPTPVVSSIAHNIRRTPGSPGHPNIPDGPRRRTPPHRSHHDRAHGVAQGPTRVPHRNAGQPGDRGLHRPARALAAIAASEANLSATVAAARANG